MKTHWFPLIRPAIKPLFLGGYVRGRWLSSHDLSIKCVDKNDQNIFPKWWFNYPIASMYGIFTYIYHKNQPHVGKYTIHGWYGYVIYYIVNTSPSTTNPRKTVSCLDLKKIPLKGKDLCLSQFISIRCWEHVEI